MKTLTQWERAIKLPFYRPKAKERLTLYAKIQRWLDTHDKKFNSGWEWREALNKYLRRVLGERK